MAYEHEKSGVTMLLDVIRNVLILIATSFLVFLIWKWHWIAAVLVAIPVYIVMMNLVGFLILPLYMLTPENKLKAKAFRGFHVGDVEQGKALTDEFSKTFNVNTYSHSSDASAARPSNTRSPGVRSIKRTTMTIREAEHILDVVSAALEHDGPPFGQHPVSALQSYSIFDIMTALKLRIANEYLQLSGRPDFEQQFSEGLKLYDSVPWQVMRSFVADDELGHIEARPVMSAVDPSTMRLDERFSSVETGSSFGDFCKALGNQDPNYWECVFQRIGIDYTAESPRGYEPVKLHVQ